MDEAKDHASVRLALTSQPACVTLVRSMVSGLGEELGLDLELVDDIKTAVSEACNNVVLHAYPNGPGPLIVEMAITEDDLEISVVDHGAGIHHAAASDERMGVGMAVINALADAAEFSHGTGRDGGTVVRMAFGARGCQLGAFIPAPGSARPAPPELMGDVLLTVTPVALLGDVLGRVTRAIAAGAHFSLDRFADLYLIVDEVTGHVRTAAMGGSISCAITARAGWLELGLGSLAPGKFDDQFRERESIALKRLVNDVRISPDGDGELLTLLITDPRR